MWLRIQQKKKEMWPSFWPKKKENVAEISAKEKERAGTPANLRGCKFDKQTGKRRKIGITRLITRVGQTV